MTSAFICIIDHGSDTDLLGIAQDVQDVFDAHSPYQCKSVKAWAHPTLEGQGLVAGMAQPNIPPINPNPRGPLA